MESAAADLADINELTHAADQWTEEVETTTPVPPEESEQVSI